MLINDKGARFINEDAYGGRVAHFITSQIGDRFYLLVDDAIFQRPSEYSKIEIAAVGETWGDVEAELGLTPGSLTTTVAIYNQHAAKGEDPSSTRTHIGSSPSTSRPTPLWLCHLKEAYYPFFTLGGLRVRPTGEVLTTDGEAIVGLYAAGRTACGLPRWGRATARGCRSETAPSSGARRGARLPSGPGKRARSLAAMPC
ncbi:MAG: FAD-binding protein [Myxococcota bacterium]